MIVVPKCWAVGQSWLHKKLRHFFTSSRHRIGQKQASRSLQIKIFAQAQTLTRDWKVNANKQRLQNEDLDWWKEKMEQLNKPSARELTKRLKYTNLLGLDDSLRNGSSKEGSLNKELLEVKGRFPREILLCRIGEFYEAVGFDACLLVEYAALNPMSGMRIDTIPRAGCPVVNLRQTLDALTSSGFSVCVYEEVKAPSRARQRKDRFVSGHAYPGSPYVYGLAEADIDLEVPEEVFVVGISKSSRGYCLVSVLEMMKTFSVEDGLTEEAVVAKLRAKTCHFIFLHNSLQHDPSGVARWTEYGEGGLLWAECQGKSCEWYDQDPVLQLLSKVRKVYDLDPQQEFRNIVFPSKGRPRPLHLGTAAQIGILPTVGIPSVLKNLLPVDSTGLCHGYLRDLLLNPPPARIATSIQAACKLMAHVTIAIPEFTCVSAAKLVKLISTKEANHIEFSRIRYLAEDVIQMHKDHQLRPILTHLLDPTSLATGLQFEQQHLVDESAQLVADLNHVLAAAADPEQEVTSFVHIPDDFFQSMESSWRGRVKRKLAEKFYEEVQKAAECLNAAVEKDFLPIVMYCKAIDAPIGQGAKAEICFSREHQAVWLKFRHSSAISRGTLVEELVNALKPAVDGKGKRVRDDFYTTTTIEEALDRYRDAVENAMWTVYEVLRRLAEDLKSKLNTIVFISVLAIVAKTLFAHVSEGKRRKWVFPKLLILEQQPETKNYGHDNGNLPISEDSQESELVFTDLVPYWVDKSQTLAVQNTVIMNSLQLLTGPNGGGKSTMLRSVAAAALLGICGLMVPATSAVVPMFDAVMLRMMPHDSPADAKSSFQMEMSELRTILLDVTNRSLVLVDELCRGTEVQKGTAITASVIEFLDAAGCLGLLSTHLHGLLDMDLNVRNLVYKSMGTTNENGVLKPTWKLKDGSCRESLAFETARREGVPDVIVQRAQEIYIAYMDSADGHREKQKSENGAEEFDGVTRINATTTLAYSNEAKKIFPVSRTEMHHTIIERHSSPNSFPQLENNLRLGNGISSSHPVHNGSLQENVAIKEGCQTACLSKLARGNGVMLEDAICIFSNICQRKLLEMRTIADNCENSLIFTTVGARERPPPATTNCSCVYMMSRPDGKFYVGQTDNISGRITAHRAKGGLKTAPFVYVQVANKSVATELETLLINQLPHSGLELVNKGDRHHRHFGTDPPIQASLPF